MKINGHVVPLNQRWIKASAQPRQTAPAPAPAPQHVSCPKCGVTGGLPSNYGPAAPVLTCNGCGAKFKFDRSTAKPGVTSIGVPVDASTGDLASRIRAARIQPRHSLNLAERIRVGRIEAGIRSSKAIRG